MIIHVAGIAGSGKTYIGNFIKATYPTRCIKVVDLDDIIIPVIQSPKGNQKDVEKARAYIKKRITAKINAIIHNYSDILFVGYDYIYYAIDNELKIYRFLLDADYKFFIKGNINMFIKQYRERAAKYIQTTTAAICAKSNSEYKQNYADDLKTYKNYTRLTQAEIIKRIILLFGDCK